MLLELENMKTQETLTVEPVGLTFGRAGSTADVQLRDQAVSKRHAKVYNQGGTWFLEDLGSSNGTYVNKQKIDGPIPLTEGMVFALSRFKFKVARIVEENGEPLFDPDDGADLAPPGPPPPAPAPVPEPLVPENGAGAISGVSHSSPSAVPASADLPPPPDGDDGDAISVGYFMVAVPKAAMQYTIWVPALALAPFVVIPKSVKEQKHKAMGKLELAAYAIPALVITAAFGQICAALASIIAGNGFVDSIVGAIVGLLVAALIGTVVGVLFGLFADKILAWLVTKLQGESDARARTNFFILTLTTAVLVAVPNGLGTILGTIPFAMILAPLLITAGSLITAFVNYTWWKSFRVYSWVPIVFLVLGGIAALVGLAGVVGNTITSIDIVTSDSPADAPDIETPDIDTPEPPDPPEDDDGKPDEDDKAKDPKPKDPEPKKDEKADDPEPAKEDGKGKKGKKDKKGKKGKKGKGDEEKPAVEDAAETDPPPPAAVIGEAGKPEMDFDDFADLVEDLDEVVKNNPGRVVGDPKAKALYQKISAARYAAKKRFDGKMAKSPEYELVHEAERQAEEYQESANFVKQLMELID